MDTLLMKTKTLAEKTADPPYIAEATEMPMNPMFVQTDMNR